MSQNQAVAVAQSCEDMRQTPRRSLHVEVTLQSDDNFYAGITGDVSVGGLFVATFAPPPAGALIELEIELPSGDRVSATGKVRWVRSLEAARDGNHPGCGIAWERIDARSIAAIRRFVEHRDTLFMDCDDDA